MPTPLDGIRVTEPDFGIRVKEGESKFKELHFGAIHWEGNCYIYDAGQLLGPVSRVIKSVYVDCSYTGGQTSPRVFMFGEGKKVGVYVDGVRSELFDEMDAFQVRSNHFLYLARRGKKWCYVIDGIIHGWHDEVSKAWVWFRPGESGGTDIAYWAKKNGKVGFWLNDVPIELFDANDYKVSSFDWSEGHIIFQVAGPKGPSHKEGVWVDGRVDRWFDNLEPFGIHFTVDGLQYIGTDREVGQSLATNGSYIGPFDNIRRLASSHLKLEPGTLVAMFRVGEDEFARIGDWTSEIHRKIVRMEHTGGHRLVVGRDEVGKQPMFTYYVNERFYCTVPDDEGFIRDNKLCFTQSVTTGYSVR